MAKFKVRRSEICDVVIEAESQEEIQAAIGAEDNSLLHELMDDHFGDGGYDWEILETNDDVVADANIEDV